MGIKGLTDQRGAFPRIGKLRKGGQRPANGKAPGKDLDHFRFDTTDPGAEATFKSAYGDEPRSINVRLPYPTLDENFQTAMEKYGAGGIEVRCDREFMQGCRVNGKFMKCFPGKNPCQRVEGAKDNGCGCKEVGRLNLIIPELQRFAYVTAETHAINDIVNLTQQLMAIEMMFGRLNGIPLVLTRRPEQISTPTSDGGRARREKWMLSIEVSPEWASRQIAASDRFALQQAATPLLAGASYALPPAMGEDDFEVQALPPAAPSYDFTQSELWLKMSNAFHNVQDADAIAAYEARAMGYIATGELPPHAQTMIAQLVEKATQKMLDRRPPMRSAPAKPAKATPVEAQLVEDIDLDWREDPLWLSLVDELKVSPVEAMQSFSNSVADYIEQGILPPVAGTEMQSAIARRVSSLQPVPVEVVK